MADRVPQRLSVAVEVLAPPPDARVLEIGCGAGVAAELVCRRLTTGHLTALDRSATAIDRAERRLAGYLEDGRADLQHRDLATFRGDGRPYDRIFAVNVNVFWARPAEVEVDRLHDLLAEDGVVHLFFETPPGSDDRRASVLTRAALELRGFRVETADLPDLLHVAARR